MFHVATYYLSMVVDCVGGYIFISIQGIFSPSRAVSQSQQPWADYKVEVVCGESRRGVAGCMLIHPLSRVHGSLWFGLLSEHQASVETRVWCGPLVQGFPLKLAGLLFSLGGSSLSFCLSLAPSLSLLSWIYVSSVCCSLLGPFILDPNT